MTLNMKEIWSKSENNKGVKAMPLDNDQTAASNGPGINPDEVRAWLKTQPKADGTMYSPSVLDSYISALIKVPMKLELPDEVSREVFNCCSVDGFDALWAAYKAAPNYYAINRGPLHGKLSCGMGAYRRYLEHLENGDSTEGSSKGAPESLPKPSSIDPGKAVQANAQNAGLVGYKPNKYIRRVDFSNTKLCFETAPVSCVIGGEKLPAVGWRDILVEATEKFIRENHPNINLLYDKPLSESSLRPFFLKEKPAGRARLLSNGHWLNVHHKIPSTISLIGKLCALCGISLSDVRIECIPKKYRHTLEPVATPESGLAPKPNTAPKPGPAPKPASRESVELPQVPEAVLRALEEGHKGGFVFNEPSIRSLEAKAGLSIDGALQEAMKKQLFHRCDDVYFLPSAAIEDDFIELMYGTVDEWINTFGCFDLAALLNAVAEGVNNDAVRDLADFEELFKVCQSSLRCAEQHGSKYVLTQELDIDDALIKVASAISRSIASDFNGAADESELRERFPAFTESSICSIMKERSDDVAIAEINGSAHYQTLDKVKLHRDLPDALEHALSRLELLNLAATEEVFHTALCFSLGLNFNKVYHIPNLKTFKRLVSLHCKGEPKREWRSGAFVKA
jgi:hypothetical protein